MEFYQVQFAVRNVFFLLMCFLEIINSANVECNFNICDGEILSCKDVGGFVFVNSLSLVTDSNTLKNVSQVCNGRKECYEDKMKKLKKNVCLENSSQAIINYQCMSFSSFQRISRNQRHPIDLDSDKNYQIFANDDLCSSAIKMKTAMPTTIYLKQFTMRYSATNNCIALIIMQNTNNYDLPFSGKVAAQLPGNVEFNIRLRCDCLLAQSEVWLIVNVSQTSSSVAPTVKTPLPFIRGQPYIVESVPLVDLANCDGNRGFRTTLYTPRRTAVSSTFRPTESSVINTFQPTIQSTSSPGDNTDMLVVIIACSVSSVFILVIFIVVLVYFCKKLRNKKRNTQINDNEQTVIYSNTNTEEESEVRPTYSQDTGRPINYENCELENTNPLFQRGVGTQETMQVTYDSCDLAETKPALSDNLDTYDRLTKKVISTSEIEDTTLQHIQNESESNSTPCSVRTATRHIIIDGDEYAVVEK